MPASFSVGDDDLQPPARFDDSPAPRPVDYAAREALAGLCGSTIHSSPSG